MSRGQRGWSTGEGQLPAWRRSGGSAPRPARRIHGWRPSSRRHSGNRCPRSRRGSSRSISLGRAASLCPTTTPDLGRWRRVGVSPSRDGWLGRDAHAPRPLGAAADRRSTASRGRHLRRAAWPTPRPGTCRRTGRCAARRGSLLLLGAQGTRLRPFAVRDRRRPLGCRADAVPPVVAGLRRAYGDARIPHADAPGEFGDGLVGHGVDLGSVSALSESVPKSADSFACTSTTKRALASSCSNWRFSASRRAILSACGSRRLRPRGTANPASAPASRALRHSTIWLEYKPSRRNNAPFAPSGAASYSAKISNLYLAVNVRRFAFSGTSGSRRSVPASSTRPDIPGVWMSSSGVLILSAGVTRPWFRRRAFGSSGMRGTLQSENAAAPLPVLGAKARLRSGSACHRITRPRPDGPNYPKYPLKIARKHVKQRRLDRECGATRRWLRRSAFGFSGSRAECQRAGWLAGVERRCVRALGRVACRNRRGRRATLAARIGPVT